MDTKAGRVPKVINKLNRTDIKGTILTRIGIGRNNYKISPGLYAVGAAESDSPVLVTANYKLSFDTLRKELTDVNAWVLVLDTRGVNVWCAAGKGTFSSAEVVRQVKLTRLEDVVQHRELILPQLSATGVSAHQVKKQSGFKVTWGPVRAADIQKFLSNEQEAEPSMRRVTFTLIERMVLVPVELSFLLKPTLWVLLAAFSLSGIGADVFSFNAMWSRGLMVFLAYAIGIVAGAVAVPILMPWIPGKAFSLKGTLTGLIAGTGIVVVFWDTTNIVEAFALLACTAVFSSYLAMNFTGSTPLTSPSGVEKEMRRAIPLQMAALLIATVMWVGSAFIQVT
ncbi:MAG: hypothetical protein JSW04_00815 [Desulfobacterales bacterium]|nr:MAG: hypothetical protein JSW04_00815 [Desulfobacterales bacterium]